MLPRPVDLRRDITRLGALGTFLALLVLDFQDAYHTLPMIPSERRLAACGIGGGFRRLPLSGLRL